MEINGVDILSSVLFENTVRAWLIAIGATLIAFFLLGLLRSIVVRQVKRLSGRTNAILDDALAVGSRSIRGWLLLVIAIWAGSMFVALPPRLRSALDLLAIFALLAQLGLSGTAGVRAYVTLYGERQLEEDAAGVMTARAIGFLVSIALWIIIFLMVLQNFGVDVTALIAGLGIGGIAIALALQKVLEDLFASLSIILDKPFLVGDFIIVDEFLGTVEHVGLKTTRLRSLSGEQLVFANSDLLASRIRNYKRMYERRVVFGFGVEYGTPQEKLEWIPGLVRKVVESLADVRFDRAHFKEYGDFSLNFEVVYYVLHPDFNLYMDRQQEINLEIYQAMTKEGIAFALPTTTVHMANAAPEAKAAS